MSHRTDQESQDEALIDSRVQSRLRSDRAYLYAENAEEQAEREDEITDEEVRYLADYRAKLRREREEASRREAAAHAAWKADRDMVADMERDGLL